LVWAVALPARTSAPATADAMAMAEILVMVAFLP
jgi:hypothetical protein